LTPEAVTAFLVLVASFHVPSTSIIHLVLYIFQISRHSFSFAKLAQAVFCKGRLWACLVIFSSFWGAVAPDPKTPWSKMKKITVIPCLCTPSSCLLLYARKININLKK